MEKGLIDVLGYEYLPAHEFASLWENHTVRRLNMKPRPTTGGSGRSLNVTRSSASACRRVACCGARRSNALASRQLSNADTDIDATVRAGLARVKAEGKTLGRPRIDATLEANIRKALHKGDLGIRKIACYSACKIDPLSWGIGVQN
jgi:hypothetical protein